MFAEIRALKSLCAKQSLVYVWVCVYACGSCPRCGHLVPGRAKAAAAWCQRICRYRRCIYSALLPSSLLAALPPLCPRQSQRACPRWTTLPAATRSSSTAATIPRVSGPTYLALAHTREQLPQQHESGRVGVDAQRARHGRLIRCRDMQQTPRAAPTTRI